MVSSAMRQRVASHRVGETLLKNLADMDAAVKGAAGGRAITRDPVDFAHRHWRGISGDAKHFVSLLLAKDAAARPTAKQVGDRALRDPGRVGRPEPARSLGACPTVEGG
jgi:hypothetical protein